jgi:hypothetical protein
VSPMSPEYFVTRVSESTKPKKSIVYRTSQFAVSNFHRLSY